MGRLVLCAPVDFAPDELGPRLAASRYSAAVRADGGRILAGVPFAVEVCDPDERMSRAFSASADRLVPSVDPAQLDAIAAHRAVLYFVADTDDTDEAALGTAQRGLLLAGALAEIGVLGVKCDSSGIAHGNDRWQDLFSRMTDGFEQGRDGDDDGYELAFAALVSAWVRLPISTEGELHSCGMHLLGRPEVGIASDACPDPRTAADLLVLLAGYLCRNLHRMADGQGFRLSATAPRYLLQSNDRSFYAPGDLFHNPWGTWTLAPDPG